MNSIQAILFGKCPRCRKGDLFKKPLLNPFSIRGMNKKCEVCQLEFEREPGFFTGAMYVSYAISVGLFLVVGFSVFYILNDPPTWIYMTVITTIVFLIFPYNFKYSRILFLHLFGGVDFENDKY